MLCWSKSGSLSRIMEIEPIIYGKSGNNHALTLVCVFIGSCFIVLIRISWKTL